MHLKPSCTGLSQETVNGSMVSWSWKSLQCYSATTVSKIHCDNFIRCRSIEGINEKLEAEPNEIIERLQKVETRITAGVDAEINNAITATCEKVDKSYAEVMAVRPKETSSAHSRAPTTTMSDMDSNIRKNVRIQGVPENPEQTKADNFVPTTDVVNGILEQTGATSHITELPRLGKFDSDRKKPRTLMLTLSTEHGARLVLTNAFGGRLDLKDKGIFVQPALSKEDSRKENLCLKKPGQLLEQNVPHENLKIRNLELYNDRVKVPFKDPVNES